MGLREFFAELADLMQRHGVDVSAHAYRGPGRLHFTCEDETEIDVSWTINAARARELADQARPRASFPVSPEEDGK